MHPSLSRSELISVVHRIMEAEGTEEEVNELITLVERNVPHPQVSDLIFFSEREMTSEEVVDAALAYRPIRLD